MGLDTTYRPRVYEDVLGQEVTAAILRQFVKEGRGFRQSYVFCGQHGSGKTTQARIFVRALLCLSPREGNPCDECSSCKTLLAGDVHEGFEELDAATKSKSEDLERILEDIQYHTFGNTRKVYLFDESHRLSKQALDKLLKPMEDTIPGTEDKSLVCIFCTTEAEKMSATIFSRCAPAFVIRAVTPEKIAERLAWICRKEGIPHEEEALLILAEVSESHIRDALMLVEGVSMLGAVNLANVTSYLRLDANRGVLDLLLNLGQDLERCVSIAAKLATEVSPSAAYERIADAALVAFRASIGVGKPSLTWDPESMAELAKKGPLLLQLASRFGAPPYRPTEHMLLLDVATLHYQLAGSPLAPLAPSSALPPPGLKASGAPAAAAPANISLPSNSKSQGTVPKTPPQTTSGGSAGVQGGVWVDPRAVGGGGGRSQDAQAPGAPSAPVERPLSPSEFRARLAAKLGGLTVDLPTPPRTEGD